MEALLDTNVLLDVALGRNPYVEHSLPVLRWAEKHPFRSALSCHCLDTVHYVLSKSSAPGESESRGFLRFLLGFLEVVPLDRDDFLFAVDHRSMNDLEDSIVEQAAFKAHARQIITHNTKDFRRSRIKAVSPRAFLENLEHQ
ncbi:MAG: type II toxin-antitoxin system VapC family toxin [Puniceicoccaceae bacterium]